MKKVLKEKVVYNKNSTKITKIIYTDTNKMEAETPYENYLLKEVNKPTIMYHIKRKFKDGSIKYTQMTGKMFDDLDNPFEVMVNMVKAK